MKDVSPEHSTINRFSTALMDKPKLFNSQLFRHHISAHAEILVNASIIKSNGCIAIEMADNRTDNRSEEAKEIPSPEHTLFLANKVYASQENRVYLHNHRLRDDIMQKAQLNRLLTAVEKVMNKHISPIRDTIKQTFVRIRHWGQCRYRDWAKTHTQNILESIAFNLYRTPRIIIPPSSPITSLLPHRDSLTRVL